MNSLPEAFSVILGRSITLGQALRMVAEGIDVASKGFRCPGENCKARVALVGIGRAEENRRKQVHFRSYRHVDGCTYIAFLKQRPKDIGLSQPVLVDTVVPVAPDRFAPDSDTDGLDGPEPAVADPPITLVSTNFTGFQVGTDRPMAFGQLQKLVLRFHQFQRGGLVDEREVVVGERTLKYSELFQQVDRQDCLEFRDSPRVWWGAARIHLHRGGPTYAVNFDASLRWEREVMRPVFFLRESWSRLSPPFPATQRRLLEQARERSVPCMVYCLTTPTRWTDGDKRDINLIPSLRSEFWFEPAAKANLGRSE